MANKGFAQQFGTQINRNGERVLASAVMSNWNLVGSIGQITGMMCLPFFTNRFGRKMSMYLYWTIIAAGTVVECFARDHRLWFLARMLGGLGVGCLQTTVPGYLAEVAPVKTRGIFLASYSLWFTAGQFFAPVALQSLSKKDPFNYLTPIYTQWSQVGLMILIYIFVPESPAWCVNAGRTDDAKKALRCLYKNVPGFDVEHAHDLLVRTVEHEREVARQQEGVRWHAIFRGRDAFRTWCSSLNPLAAGFLGLGLFSTYGSYFYQQVGLDDPFMVTSITSSINIVASLVIIAVSDVIGRRPMSVYGSALAFLCCGVIGILGVIPHSSATGPVLILFSCLWSACHPPLPPCHFGRAAT